jgi:NAD(P)-dependent dehydrogenase (short-subunit alcohol dehydrogenase family)
LINTNWKTAEIPNLEGKVIIITGATSGLGKEAARVLAGKGATVIIATKNIQKADVVSAVIQEEFPSAIIDTRNLDLGSLDSVKSFTKTILSDYKRLDILINNAGIMMCPYSKTKDGFEIQMGTNHLGNFALTGLLMPLLLQTANSREVATSSVAHRAGNINFKDINWESRKYNKNKAYSDSKLANLYFTHELTRKFNGIDGSPTFTSAHPGFTKTELDRHSGIAQVIGNLIAQKVYIGTLPTLRAASDSQAKSGDYFGPSMLEQRISNNCKIQCPFS